jgi:hypothetical protein
MTRDLQDKDARWRDRDANSSVPVFDPGLSPLGTDAEAGGAPASMAADPGPTGDRPPLPVSPESGGMGVRLTPRVWSLIAVVFAVVVVAVAIASF